MSSLAHPMSVSTLSRSGENIKINADGAVLEQLAGETGVDKVTAFAALLKVAPYKKGGAKVTGEVEAQVEQACVVSNQPVVQDIKMVVDRVFLPPEAIAKLEKQFEEGELILDPELNDVPDEIESGVIDLWHILIEELCLEIDLYPRKEGASVDDRYSGALEQETAENETTNKPFSELKALINKKRQ